MAKLSAYGRHELARYEKSEVSTEPLDQGAINTITIAIMSDGKILSKWKLTGGRWKDKPLTASWKVTGMIPVSDLESYETKLVKNDWKKVVK